MHGRRFIKNDWNNFKQDRVRILTTRSMQLLLQYQHFLLKSEVTLKVQLAQIRIRKLKETVELKLYMMCVMG